jgi:hypothetical protein
MKSLIPEYRSWHQKLENLSQHNGYLRFEPSILYNGPDSQSNIYFIINKLRSSTQLYHRRCLNTAQSSLTQRTKCSLYSFEELITLLDNFQEQLSSPIERVLHTAKAFDSTVLEQWR